MHTDTGCSCNGKNSKEKGKKKHLFTCPAYKRFYEGMQWLAKRKIDKIKLENKKKK